MQPEPPAVPAGWYPHPTAPGWEAYWSGTAWGTETRPAQEQPQPAPAADQAEADQPVTDQAAEQQQAAEQDVVSQQPAGQQTDYEQQGTEQQTYEQQGGEQRITPAQEASGEQPESGFGSAAGTAAVAAGGYAASQSAGATETGSAEPEIAEPRSTEPQPTTEQAGAPPASDREPAASEVPAASPGGGGAPPGAEAAATTTGEKTESAFPAVICVLGAIVAAVGAVLPQAKLMFNGAEVDLLDNTMVAAGYGIAVIAAAVLGAGIAIWAQANRARTWLPILLGAVILAIAVFAGTAGLSVTTSGVVEGLSPDAQPDPSTGIFAAAAGGLLMILGGIGLARARR